MGRGSDAIAILRALAPRRGLSPKDARQLAELQALEFLTLSGIGAPAVPEEIITKLPQIHVEYREGWPTSGLAAAVRNEGWLIVVRADEAHVRQRFSLVHEFKHVLDDPFVEHLYPSHYGHSAEERAEGACDYFAACVLMPRAWIKRDWAAGIQTVDALARRYDVSRIAIRYRLEQIGLTPPAPRCDRPNRRGALE